MLKYEFYHGTSRIRYDSIKKHGFVLADPKYRNWLAPIGVYFIVNRPLVALRFSREAAAADDSETVLLKVPISCPPNLEQVLDLTTDDGMFLLFRSYELARRLYHAPNPKLGSNVPPTYAAYRRSLVEKHSRLMETLRKPFDQWKEHKNVNWDTLAMQVLVDEFSIILIIAALHEGTTFNMRFTSDEPEYVKARSHKGIRARDHIEVCVIDPAYIDVSGITEIDPNHEISKYGSKGAGFVDIVTTQLPDPD